MSDTPDAARIAAAKRANLRAQVAAPIYAAFCSHVYYPDGDKKSAQMKKALHDADLLIMASIFYEKEGVDG